MYFSVLKGVFCDYETKKRFKIKIMAGDITRKNPLLLSASALGVSAMFWMLLVSGS